MHIASRAKIPSQLAAYKIAKSLRLKNEKKRQIRENKLGNRKDSVDDMLNIMVNIRDTYAITFNLMDKWIIMFLINLSVSSFE